MKVLSIIPVKDLDHAKTRLASILSLRERQDLILEILCRTTEILRSCQALETILVLSPDPRVLSFARELGVLELRDQGRGLNEALKQATGWSIYCGFEALLVLPADIPFLNKNDIKAMICMSLEGDRIVVIAPNKEADGTNALLVKPPGIIEYSFGTDSFTRHRDEALSKRLILKIYQSASIEFDLDYPEQYRLFLKEKNPTEKVTGCGDKTCNFDSSPWNTPHPDRG
jgi:2-phospho-L-lactate guanylyltransferase